MLDSFFLSIPFAWPQELVISQVSELTLESVGFAFDIPFAGFHERTKNIQNVAPQLGSEPR